MMPQRTLLGLNCSKSSGSDSLSLTASAARLTVTFPCFTASNGAGSARLTTNARSIF